MAEKLTYSFINQEVNKKNGVLLSKEYFNSSFKLDILCLKCNTNWKISYDNIRGNKWCPVCGRNKSNFTKINKSIEKIKKIVKEKEGLVISDLQILHDNYINKIEVKCKNEHIWKTHHYYLFSGSWCPECAGNIKKSDEFLIKVITDKGGQLISYYENNVIVKCKFNHIWTTDRKIILNNHWCNICCSGLYENICRSALEQIFKASFLKCRPEFLKHNNSKLELDGFNEELKLAFEHQGVQHYKAGVFGMPEEEFQKIKYRDSVKEKLCLEHGVKLLIIPQLEKFIKIKDIKSFLKNELIKLEVLMPEDFDNIILSFDHLYTEDNNKEKIKLLQNVAKQRNGELLSNKYIRSTDNLKWKCCDCLLVWEASPFRIINKNSWCPTCKHKKKNIQDMIKLAELKEGKCLSKDYINNNTKLIWQCKFGHVWEQKSRVIMSNKWCPHCYKLKINKLSI
jgi:hypothetical protein